MPAPLRYLTVGLITLFWATMWALLIRSELQPEGDALHRLPPALVLRQFFEHGESSDLYLREGGLSLAHLRLEPALTPAGGTLQFVGNLQLTPPGAPTQRAGWSGRLFLTPQLAPERLEANWSIRGTQPAEMPPVRVEVEVLFPAQQAWYRYTEGEKVLAEERFPLTEAGLQEVLQTWGMNFGWSSQLQAAAAGGPPAEVQARQTRILFHGDRIDCTSLVLKRGVQTWGEAFISQTGQILEVHTLLGTTLTSE